MCLIDEHQSYVNIAEVERANIGIIAEGKCLHKICKAVVIECKNNDGVIVCENSFIKKLTVRGYNYH